MAVIRRFRPGDQGAARALILAGLEEHWGRLDPACNRDLDDIGQTFAGGEFWVADEDGRLVGTAGLVVSDPGVGEVVRVSVVRDRRQAGLSRDLVAAIVAAARARGLQTLIVETTLTWADAIAFYDRLGFRRTRIVKDDQYFELDLSRGLT